MTLTFVSTLLLIAATGRTRGWTPRHLWSFGGQGVLNKRVYAEVTFFVHQKLPPLSGVLDDMAMESCQSSSDELMDASCSNNNSKDGVYEDLLTELIFSTGDTRTDIFNRYETCCDPGFIQWLETSEKLSEDVEEQQALRSLLDMIEDAKREHKLKRKETLENVEKEEEEEALVEEVRDASTGSSKQLSTAEVLQKAKEIDQAFMNTEASEEEQPPDFMRDAKATVGLSEFNNHGRMRVGGI